MIIAQSHRPTILFKKKSIYSSDKKTPTTRSFTLIISIATNLFMIVRML